LHPRLSLRGHIRRVNASRYLRSNDPSSNHIEIPEIVLAGDFDISFDALSLNASTPNMILGNSANSDNNGVFINTYNVTVRDDGGNTTYTNGSAFPSKILNKVRINKTGATVTIFINGQPRGSGVSTSPFKFNLLCTRKSFYEFELNGILADVTMHDNGILKRDYPIDDASNVIANKAASLGPELVTNSDFSDGTSNWGAGSDALLSESSGVLTVSVTTPDTFGNAFQSIDTEAGKEYFVEIDVRGSTGATNILCGISPTPTGNRTILNLDGSGQNELRRGTFTGDGSTVYLQLGTFGDGSSASYGNAGVKEAPGYGRVVNGNASDWMWVEKRIDGNYIGPEIITQTVWENPAGAGSQWTYEPETNSWLYNGDGSLNTLVPIPLGEQPDFFNISGHVERVSGSGGFGITANGVVDSDTVSDAQFNISNPFRVNADLDKNISGGVGFKRRSGTLSVRLFKQSMKRIVRCA